MSKFKRGDKVEVIRYIPLYGDKLNGVLTVKNVSKLNYTSKKAGFILEFYDVDLRYGIREDLFKPHNRKGKIDRFYNE